MTTLIHVNQHHIRLNAQDQGNRPVYTVKRGGETRYAREVIIHGPSRLTYNGSQLSCGARAWLSVSDDVEVELVDEMSYSEAKEAA